VVLSCRVRALLKYATTLSCLPVGCSYDSIAPIPDALASILRTNSELGSEYARMGEVVRASFSFWEASSAPSLQLKGTRVANYAISANEGTKYL
jgi:hypothetical protein